MTILMLLNDGNAGFNSVPSVNEDIYGRFLDVKLSLNETEENLLCLRWLNSVIFNLLFMMTVSVIA
jgi:hypothetical protein